MDCWFGSFCSDCSSFCSGMRQGARCKSCAVIVSLWRQGRHMRTQSKHKGRVQPGLRDPFISRRQDESWLRVASAWLVLSYTM